MKLFSFIFFLDVLEGADGVENFPIFHFMEIFQPLQFFLGCICSIWFISVEILSFTCRESLAGILDFLDCLFARRGPSACASWGISSGGLWRGTWENWMFCIIRFFKRDPLPASHQYSQFTFVLRLRSMNIEHVKLQPIQISESLLASLLIASEGLWCVGINFSM